MESHQRDHENYVACSQHRRRRAKALLDFERHDDDELGFRKNDIITVRGLGGGRILRRDTPSLPPFREGVLQAPTSSHHMGQVFRPPYSLIPGESG